MNRKGQTLVVFVLLLPLLILCITFVINSGNNYLRKRQLINNVKEAIRYRFELEASEEIIYEQVLNYLNKNIDNVDSIAININENYIKITVSIKVEPLLPMIIKTDIDVITVAYQGYISNDQLIIEKE